MWGLCKNKPAKMWQPLALTTSPCSCLLGVTNTSSFPAQKYSCRRIRASVELRICAKAGAVVSAHQPEERRSYTAGDGRCAEDGHSVWVPGLVPRCLRAGRCWGRRCSACTVSHPWDDALGGAMATFSPSSVSQSLAKIVPPAASAPPLWSLQRFFFPWRSKAGMSHPLLVAGAHILPALPLHFPWAQGSLLVPVVGTTLRSESPDGEFCKNNPPAWLLLPSIAGGWRLKFRGQERPCSLVQDTPTKGREPSPNCRATELQPLWLTSSMLICISKIRF